ncbi:MAG: hypothetical protein ACI9MC_000870 [Kiritimatiellia bacterium]|jgi:hypothetical protein
MYRCFFLTLLLPLAGCETEVERSNLLGLWGRVADSEHEVFEFAESIDATGLTDVRPAFRMHRYPTGEVPREVKRGRWDVIHGDLVVTPTWSLDDTEVNRNVVWEIVDFTERDLTLKVDPEDEATLVFVTLSQLP